MADTGDCRSGAAALSGSAQGDAEEQSLFSWGVTGIVLLVLTWRGHEWARVAFLTISIWGLCMLAVMAVTVQFIPSATIQINWIEVGLSAIAIVAALKARQDSREYTLPLRRQP